MPELREYYTAYCMILRFLQEVGPQEVVFIWGDDNTPDHPNSRKRDPPPPPECIVQLLNSETQIIRGNGHYRGNISPSQDISGPELKGKGMILRDVETNPQNVMLDMFIYWIRIQLSQHSFPQVWNKRIWNEISRVCQWKQGFKIGIAFEFSEYVLCFATTDFLFSECWSDNEHLNRDDHLITHIIKWSAESTVGPFDFCGIGQVIRQGKIIEVAYCWEDPCLTLTLQYRNKASRVRRSNVKPGQRPYKIDDPKTWVLKLKLEEEQKKHRLQVAHKGKQARKRLSIDMHLAADDSLY
ncbi:hypothetical protein M422DRAFT_251578 [Sphaerobolus stellatus SS14]|uniref:Uncharacterized protein n=1 Tax=Sphaerobolus stellatus (strain SS14) TaxID=990650 RepID=A0A0C9VD85_SPHS4|nr:hypothetical protein M422DRAFT_251578 [Sphaerobolus stellatus SS14]